MMTNTNNDIPQVQVDDGKKKSRWTFRMPRRKSWREMSPVQRGANIVLMIVEFVFTGWALWDIKHRSPDQIKGNKRTWMMASLIQPFGPLIYLVFGRKTKNSPATA
jgi:hypothetical protein